MGFAKSLRFDLEPGRRGTCAPPAYEIVGDVMTASHLRARLDRPRSKRTRDPLGGTSGGARAYRDKDCVAIISCRSRPREEWDWMRAPPSSAMRSATTSHLP